MVRKALRRFDFDCAWLELYNPHLRPSTLSPGSPDLSTMGLIDLYTLNAFHMNNVQC